MNGTSLKILGTAALLACTGSAFAAGWEGQIVKADWLYPDMRTILETQNVLVRPAIELPDSLIDNDSSFFIDIGPDTVQFNFTYYSYWTETDFNGWSFSDLNGTIPAIAGYSVDAVSPGISNAGDIVTSFDADNVKANFAGVINAGNGDFIRLKVKFASPPSPWTDVGSGLAGTSGVPILEGTGSLLANTSGTLDLTKALPSSLAILFMSITSAPASFKGGTLVPVPVGQTIVLLTDGAGAIALTIERWPIGVPPGSTFYFQYAIQDAAGPQGASLSNALKAVTP